MRSVAAQVLIGIVAWIIPIHLWVAQTLPVTAPAGAMPREELDRIDRAELGSLYQTALAGTYYEIHKLLEKYFSATSTLERKEWTHRIGALAVDANLVGRLVRVHLDWQQLAAGPQFVDAHVGPQHVQYYLGISPHYDRMKRWPLVIKLPPFAPFLATPRPSSNAIAALYNGWINDELGRHPDALVLIPMLDTEEGFGPSYAGMNSVMTSMQHALSQANIDPARVYLVGQDGAANAVWNIGLHFSTYFAAINPFAGSIPADWQRLRFENLRNTAVVTWNDVDNKDDPVADTRQVVQVLRRFKCDVTYQETQHLGSEPSRKVVEEAYRALLAHRRLLYPEQINIASSRPDTLFNRSDWVQMYQATRPGHEQHLTFRRSGDMAVDANSMSIRATIADNKIEAVTDNVESMRFYVNDQMIDFSKAVTLNINSHEKFHQAVKPNLEEMLKDQRFLGRGWRYFTAVIDVDFGEPASRPTTTPH